ncbi:MAG: carbohydrate kinase family protein [Promethearchaeota archaeon]
MKKLDVLCVGALLGDYSAKVERHPGPDDEVFVPRLELFAGGSAANTSVGLARLGVTAGFMGKVGEKDALGAFLREDLVAEGVNVDGLVLDPTLHTGLVFVAVDATGDRRMYAHSGAANEFLPRDVAWPLVESSKLAYLSSLRRLDAFVAVARRRRKLGLPVVANPGMLGVDRPWDELEPLVKSVDVLALSRAEAAAVARNLPVKRADPEKVARALLEVGGPAHVVVTTGASGCLVASSGGTRADVLKVESFEVPVVDATGAGDAFMAGFLATLVEFVAPDGKMSVGTEQLSACCRTGAAVAALAIQKAGARNGLPVRADLEAFLRERG